MEINRRSIVKLAIAILGILLPIAIFVATPYYDALFKERMEITFRITEGPNLGDIGLKGRWGEIEMRVDGESVGKARFLAVEFENTGSIPIRREDFDAPIRVEFEGEGDLYAAKTDFDDEGLLSPDVEILPQALEIQPLLLNPGDMFAVEMLVGEGLEVAEPTSRIAGLSTMSEYQYEDQSGIYVEVVTANSRSFERARQTIMLLNPWVLAITVFLAWYVCALTIRLLVTRLPRRVQRPMWAVGVLSYCVAMTCWLLWFGYMVENGRSKGGALTVTLLVLLAATFVGNVAGSRMRKAMPLVEERQLG